MTGLRHYKDDGTLLFDTGAGNTIGKVLGRVTVTQAAGSITDPKLAAGTPFAFTLVDKIVTFSGTTLSWGANAISGEVFYGVSTGYAAYNPTKTPGTPGFLCRNPDGSFVIDETFFALQYTGKFSFTPTTAGIWAYDCAYPDDGENPVVAVRSLGGYFTLINVTRLDANTVRMIAQAQAPFTVYFFGKAKAALSGVAGLRWYSPAGVLLGDTSIPLFNPVYVMREFTYAGPNSIATGPVAGRNYAILVNMTGARTETSGGDGHIIQDTYRMASRVDAGTTETVYIGYIHIASGGGGSGYGGGDPGSSVNITNGYYSLIDVTGFA